MRRTLTAVALSTALLVTGAGLATSAVASGGHDDRIIRTGSCSGSADWKLKAKSDDGRLEVEWEVDSNRAGQTWRVRVRDDGDLVVKTRAATGGASGSFSIQRQVANRAGGDSIVARSRDLSSGQLCVGRLTF
jgi:hypothetical protein